MLSRLRSIPISVKLVGICALFVTLNGASFLYMYIALDRASREIDAMARLIDRQAMLAEQTAAGTETPSRHTDRQSSRLEHHVRRPDEKRTRLADHRGLHLEQGELVSRQWRGELSVDAGDGMRLASQWAKLAGAEAHRAGQAVTANAHDIRAASLVLLFAVIALGIGIAWLSRRAVVDPLRHLAVAMGRVASEGNLMQHVQHHSRDEIGQVAAAFNRMIDSLRETTVSKGYVDDIIRSMADALIVTAPTGEIRMANEACERLLGRTEGSLVGTPVAQLFARTDDLCVLRERLTREGSARGIETTFATGAGASVPVVVSGALLGKEHAGPAGWVLIAQDDTVRRRAEARIRVLARFPEENPGLVMGIDAAGTVVYANRPARELFALRAGDSVPPLLLPMVQDALAKGGTRSYECAHRDRVILISVVPQAGLAGVNLYGRDDTERKRAERELIAASEAALAAARMKSEFLANISHELRTPLNGVLGMLQLIEDTRLDEEQRDYVRVAARSGSALLDLINDVLDFSKIEAGGLELESIPLCAHEIAETACQMLAEQAHEKGLEIGCLIEPSVPRWVKGDPTRLRQVLINLTANAVKFTDQGSVLVGVRRVSSDDETGTITLKFTVTDTGIGIDESARERIFDAFTQADGSVTRKHGGTGLGLTISRELVRAMGGEITLESELGAGSEFSFTTTFLPAEQEDPESHATGFAGRHAVVLSANDGYGAVLCHQLETLGIRTHLTASAPAARACAQDTGAGFLFVDHDAVRGSELARLVTELGSSAPPPALICLLPFGRRARSELPPSTRTLMKPVRLAQLLDLLSATDPPRSPRPARPARLGPQADFVRRVLVVDDNAVNRRIALAMLAKLGVEAESAASGIECLGRLDTEAFSLILMDCQMPILDGYETTARLRRRPRGAGIPVVAMTANAGPEERTRCIEAGMNGHLAKPMTLATLSAALERWLAPQSTTTIDAA